MGSLTGFTKEHDFARELGLTVWALRAWRKRGYGPPAGKLGKLVVYRRSDIDSFLKSCTPGGED